MVSLTASPAAARRAGLSGARMSRAALRSLPHVVMLAAMIPCAIGAAAGAHLAAAAVLFALAIGHAVRARRAPALLAPVVDALAMAALSVAAAMCGHATGAALAAGHEHGDGMGVVAVIVALTLAGWGALRLSAMPRRAGMPRPAAWVAAGVPTVMVLAMAALTLVHSL